jgi:hypothetical protein
MCNAVLLDCEWCKPKVVRRFLMTGIDMLERSLKKLQDVISEHHDAKRVPLHLIYMRQALSIIQRLTEFSEGTRSDNMLPEILMLDDIAPLRAAHLRRIANMCGVGTIPTSTEVQLEVSLQFPSRNCVRRG